MRSATGPNKCWANVGQLTQHFSHDAVAFVSQFLLAEELGLALQPLAGFHPLRLLRIAVLQWNTGRAMHLLLSNAGMLAGLSILLNLGIFGKTSKASSGRGFLGKHSAVMPPLLTSVCFTGEQTVTENENDPPCSACSRGGWCATWR